MFRGLDEGAKKCIDAGQFEAAEGLAADEGRRRWGG
jgi:hypothetical protein